MLAVSYLETNSGGPAITNSTANGLVALYNSNLQHGAGGVSELRGVIGGLNFVLRERVGWRTDDKAGAIEKVGEIGVVVDAVKDKVVLFFTLTIGGEVTLGLAFGSIGGNHTCCELSDEDPVPTGERGLVDDLCGKHLTYGGVFGLEVLRDGVDLNRFRNCAGFERQIGSEALLDVEVQPSLKSRCEARGCSGNLILPDFNRRKDIDAFGI
jgi:hypothetical protein